MEHGAIQVDGLALEVNITPAKTPQEFVSNIHSTMKCVRELVPWDFQIAMVSSATFNKDVFDSTPQCYKTLGCEPDYNASAYTVPKAPPATAKDECYRTAGGHLHLGYTVGADPSDPRHLYDCARWVSSLEGVFQRFQKDPDQERKKLYGESGSFRPKEYGFEWRSPSNWWMNWTEKEQKALFQLLRGYTASFIYNKCGHCGPEYWESPTNRGTAHYISQLYSAKRI